MVHVQDYIGMLQENGVIKRNCSDLLCKYSILYKEMEQWDKIRTKQSSTENGLGEWEKMCLCDAHFNRNDTHISSCPKTTLV